MTTYAFGGVKGGVGKTTLSLNVASVLCSMGRKVMVLDTDDQKALCKRVSERSGQDIPQLTCTFLEHNPKAPRYIAETIQRFERDYDDVIIDCPPGKSQPALRSALIVADVLVTPIAPSAIDKDSMEQMDALVGDARVLNPNLRALILLNASEFKATESYTAEFREALSDFVQYTIMQCQISRARAFKYGAMQGRSVLEYDEEREDRMAKCRGELNEFIKELLNVPTNLQEG